MIDQKRRPDRIISTIRREFPLSSTPLPVFIFESMYEEKE
jgi:hypothetical protein